MPYVFCDWEKCTGCRACELVCSAFHEKVFNPSRSRISVVREEPAIDIAITCRQCSNPPCSTVCPTGAIRRPPSGIVEIDDGRCIGCGACAEACPFGAIIVHPEKGVAVKCDLCGGDPRCVKQCTPDALRLLSSERLASDKRLSMALKLTRQQLVKLGLAK